MLLQLIGILTSFIKVHLFLCLGLYGESDFLVPLIFERNGDLQQVGPQLSGPAHLPVLFVSFLKTQSFLKNHLKMVLFWT